MILVTGATGTIGRHLVKQLAAQGARFKALVRDEAKGKALGVDHVVGDLCQPESLRAALAGVDRLFLNSTPGEALSVGQPSAIALAQELGVRRVVRISSRGASPDAPTAMGRAHNEVDAQLLAAKVEGAILKPGVFMQNLFRYGQAIREQGKFFGAYSEGRVAFIDCADIAACAAALLTSDRAVAGAHVLTGGEALTHAEVAAKLSAQLGKRIEYVNLPVEQMVTALKGNGMPPTMAEDLGKMMTMLARGQAAETTDAVRALAGRPPRTFDQFLADNLEAFR